MEKSCLDPGIWNSRTSHSRCSSRILDSPSHTRYMIQSIFFRVGRGKMDQGVKMGCYKEFLFSPNLTLPTQPQFTCLKLTMETLERGLKVWNMFKTNNKDTRTMPLASCWCLYCWLWTHSNFLSSVSIVNFEHVIAGWVRPNWLRTSSKKGQSIIKARGGYFLLFIKTIIFWYCWRWKVAIMFSKGIFQKTKV